MHEMSIAMQILDIAMKEAKVNNAQKVLSIKIRAGELRGIVSDLLTNCFDIISKGTMAEEASISVEELPLEAQCSTCGRIFRVQNYTYQCPHCQSKNVETVQGLELVVQEIEVQ